MQKFIAAFDGLDFTESTLKYALFLAKQGGAHLVGVFLEDFTRHSYSAADIMRYEGGSFDQHIQELNAKDKEERDKSIETFEAACRDAGVTYSVHRDRNVALQELLHESIYSDLLIVGAGDSFTRYEEPAPTRFVRDLLNDVQCPVVLVPEKYRHFYTICFLYDGSPSSVYAVKIFSHIFPSMDIFEEEVITVKELKESMHLPDNRLMKEFMKRHYPKAQYRILKGEPETQIIEYLKGQKKAALVVLGAYRRSRLSRVFKPSMADKLVQQLKWPLFIAHNKS